MEGEDDTAGSGRGQATRGARAQPAVTETPSTIA